MSLSPSSTTYMVYLVCQLKDRNTGIVFHCDILIGEKPTARNFSDAIVVREVMRWISSIRFLQPAVAKMVVQFDIPEGQAYMIPYFHTRYLLVDLRKTLGVPIQEIYNASFEVIKSDCIIVPQPKGSTDYPY